jgi:hypothetical protein
MGLCWTVTTLLEDKMEQYEQSNDSIPDDEMALAEEIASREHANAVFATLPADKRRVAIAQDVLKWLGEGKLTPAPGRYLSLAPEVTDVINGFSCSACALGALFACAVEHGLAGGTVVAGPYCDLWDGTKIPCAFDGSRIRSRLEDAGFSREQLGLIECAFEGESGVPGEARADAGYYDGNKNAVIQAYMFHRRYFKDPRTGPSAVMRAIMQNIIDNGGTFIPGPP